jgi:thiamine pyrophosphate-dependent acetolactate synthase large subunit-like protein
MAADLLLKATAPVVLVGTGVDWSGAQKEVQELSELLSLPVAASYTAKGVFPENHPLALGCLGAGSRPYARKFFLESDLILALGTTFSEGTTLGFGHRIIPEKAKIIQIDIDPDELGRNYPTQLSVQADVKTALRGIIDAVKDNRPSATVADSRRAQEIQEAKQAWQNDLDKKTAGEGMTYDSVLKTLNELLTGKETLVTSGMTGDLLRNIDAATPIIHAGEFRAIGTAFATSLGVKLGLPNSRVVCVTGDGSFMMEQQELATARLHNIPVLNIVLHNNAYGGMKRDQLNHYNGRVIGTELFVPDLARLAELYGAKGHTITRPEEVRPVLQKSLASDDFIVVDVKVDK